MPKTAVSSGSSDESHGPVHTGTLKGVRKRAWGRWVSEIRVPRSRERIWLGSFPSPRQAARAYDAATLCLRGASARLNFISSAHLLPQIHNFISNNNGELAKNDIQAIATAAAAAAAAPSFTGSSPPPSSPLCNPFSTNQGSSPALSDKQELLDTTVFDLNGIFDDLGTLAELEQDLHSF